MKTLLKIILLSLSLILISQSILAKNCDVDKLHDFAVQLDNSKIESVSALILQFERIIKNKSDKCISLLFYELRKNYYGLLKSYEASQNIWEFNPESYQEESDLRKKLNIVGWDLLMTEGTYYIGETGYWFLDQYETILSDDWKKYLQQRKLEISQGFSEDAGLVIKWDDLRKRIIIWEKFLIQYPKFPEKDKIKDYMDIYLSTYLTGMDNSRIWNYDKKKLSENAKKSYLKFLTDNKKSEYYKIINEYYNILNRNSFTLTEKTNIEINNFLSKYNIDSMIGMQPPTY